MKERKNVYQLPAGDKTLEWYSKAVIEMKTRATTDPRSWNYQAAMHGFDASLSFWQGAAPLPSPSDQARYWKQCQHGSWFFLPWHRMYLAYFEEIVAQTIVELGGPPGWALPFWDYSDTANPNARTMPDAFTNPGSATNGLWMAGRLSNTIPVKYVSLKALNTIPYTGDGITSPLGFGGPETSFSHRGGNHGELESLPHDMVHVSIGGAMGDPRTAALDPIFWLHHANIDRLWQVWLNKGNRANPTKSSWLDYKFEFHDGNGNKAELKCSQVEDTSKVLSGYTYEGVAPAARVSILESLSLSEKRDFSMPLEVAAATNQKVDLRSQNITVHLRMAPARGRIMNFQAFRESLNQPLKPKTTYLHFENVTGKGVPPIHDVYLNVPETSNNKDSYYAGSLSFFGVEEASVSSLHNSGSGQHYALEISELMNTLRNSPDWKDQQLDISIEPSRKMEEGTFVTIGRISLYSE